MTSICKKIIGGAVLGVSLLGGAQAVPLSDLLAGGHLTNGNLVFDQWTLGTFSASDGRAFDAAMIDVLTIDDGGLPGLSFTVNQGQLSIGGDGIYAFVDLPFGFRAMATDGMGIQAVHLHMGLATLGSVDLLDGFNDDGAYIHEDLGSAAGLADLGALATEFSILDSAQTVVLDDATSFAARTSVWISKNTLTWAVESTDSANLVSFSQRFDVAPAIPEPSTYALMLVGLASLVVVGRRRRAVGR